MSNVVRIEGQWPEPVRTSSTLELRKALVVAMIQAGMEPTKALLAHYVELIKDE